MGGLLHFIIPDNLSSYLVYDAFSRECMARNKETGLIYFIVLCQHLQELRKITIKSSQNCGEWSTLSYKRSLWMAYFAVHTPPIVQFVYCVTRSEYKRRCLLIYRCWLLAHRRRFFTDFQFPSSDLSSLRNVLITHDVSISHWFQYKLSTGKATHAIVARCYGPKYQVVICYLQFIYRRYFSKQTAQRRIKGFSVN